MDFLRHGRAKECWRFECRGLGAFRPPTRREHSPALTWLSLVPPKADVPAEPDSVSPGTGSLPKPHEMPRETFLTNHHSTQKGSGPRVVGDTNSRKMPQQALSATREISLVTPDARLRHFRDGSGHAVPTREYQSDQQSFLPRRRLGGRRTPP